MEKLFGKYPLDIEVDPTLEGYISLKKDIHTFGRIGTRKKKVIKGIVERLANKLMRGGTGEKVGGKVIRTHGRLQGKKSKVIKIIKDAFNIVNKKTNRNPIEVLVEAIKNSAPREDVTRVEYGGIMYQVAVDISPKRRIDVSLRNIALAAIISSFDKKETLAEALAKEIILAANNDSNSYAIKRRDEIERIARSAR
jgi:small subunit ribosomal protein S7